MDVLSFIHHHGLIHMIASDRGAHLTAKRSQAMSPVLCDLLLCVPQQPEPTDLRKCGNTTKCSGTVMATGGRVESWPCKLWYAVWTSNHAWCLFHLSGGGNKVVPRGILPNGPFTKLLHFVPACFFHLWALWGHLSQGKKPSKQAKSLSSGKT